MNLVIYDSNYGNTRKVAETIAASLGDGTQCISVDNLQAASIRQCDLLVVGCPINAWHPTPKMSGFLNNLAPGQLSGVRAAAFDTRVDSFFSGNTARQIAHKLRKAGAALIMPPQGFIVTGKEGPLASGELDKVTNWATSIRQLAVEASLNGTSHTEFQ